MAKIDVYASNLQELSAALKRAEKSLEEMQSLVSSAQSGLAMKVSARANINEKISSAKKKIISQNSKVRKMASLTAAAAEEFTNADQKSGRRTNNIFSNVQNALTAVGGAVGGLFSSLALQHHTTIAAVFLPSGTLLSSAILTSLTQFFQGFQWQGGVGNSSNGVHDGRMEESSIGNSTISITGNQQVSEEQSQINSEVARQQMLDEINSRYQKMKKGRKKDYSYKGKCPVLVWDQLREMGIVGNGESAAHGKDYAKILVEKGKTSKGYTCTGYKGNNALDQLLEANKGKYPITNVVCSFNQGGNIPSAENGHVMLISKIDESGNVYFVDNTSLCRQGDGNYQAVCMPLKEFKAWYFEKVSKKYGAASCSGITHLQK